MAASEERVLDRIRKLLALAAPDSGTTDEERASAALKALDLADQHDLEIVPRSRTEDERREHRQRVAKNVWFLAIAPYHISCNACGELISPLDTAWACVHETQGRMWRHNYGDCAVR